MEAAGWRKKTFLGTNTDRGGEYVPTMLDGVREELEEKLADKISKDQREIKEESLLPEGWKQQDGAEVLLHLEGSRLSNTDRGDENASNIVGYIK